MCATPAPIIPSRLHSPYKLIWLGNALRLLIVEDDLDLAMALADALVRRGYFTDHAQGTADAQQMLEVAQYAAILLDLGLPDGDGLDFLRKVRRSKDPIPILITTARESIGDRVAGLDAGADDYVVKPLDADELAARIGAVMRRRGTYLGVQISFGNIMMDTASGDVSVAGQHVTLSARERQLAELLLRRAGQVVRKRLAEDQLFGLDDPVGSNAVEVYVHRLRRKLEAAEADASIETVRGVGYLLRQKAG